MGGLGSLLVAIAETAFFSIPLALSLWALLDCARRPEWAWALTARSRQVWMVAILCGILLVPAGLAISTYYLVRVRAEVAGVEGGKLPDL
jgi:uncharacterized membrane protein